MSNMSTWSKSRKLSIVMTLLVIATLVISGVLFLLLYTRPTCDDGVQNGLELGVDCGGTCAALCPTTTKKLIDIWTRTFPVTDGVYAAVAYIENQNESLYVPEVQFEIELYDKNNKAITRHSTKTTIMPNSITPIFVPYILTGQRRASSASFHFTEEPTFSQMPYPYAFNIADVYTETPEDKPPYVRAVVTNIGGKIVKEADFVAILYDEEDIAVAASRTFEENIRPQETRTIQYSWVKPIELRKGQCPGGQCIKQIKRVEIKPILLQW